MLQLRRLAPGGERYYLATVEAGREPGCQLVEPDGYWLGRAADALAAAGAAVTAPALGALLAGADPLSGDPLDPCHHRVRVAAYDCMFAAPKPVSVLHALGGPDSAAAVRAAHDASVAATLGYLERAAASVRRGAGGPGGHERVTLPASSGLAGAAFVHRSSRAGDPHLHTHLLVANLAASDDGRWSALDARGLYLHASAASALYSAQLRAELGERLGLSFDPLGASELATFAGIDRRVVAAFSQRSAAIAEDLAAQRRSGGRAAALAATRTRPAKDLSVSYEELVEQWQKRAIALGLSWRRLDELAVARPTGGVGTAPVARRRAADVELPLGALARRDLLVAMCRSRRAGLRVEEAERLVDSLVGSGAVLRSGTARPGFAAHPLGRGPRAGQARRARRFLPAGVSEDRYATPATLALEQSWCRLLAGGAPGVELLALGQAAGAADPSAAAALAALAARHAAAGAPLAALLGGGWLRSACVEALTGIEAVPARGALPPASALLVEEWLVAQAPAAAGRLLRDVEAGRRALVVAVAGRGAATRGAGGAHPAGTPPQPAEALGAAASRPTAEPHDSAGVERHDAGGVEVVTAPSPDTLLETLVRDAGATGAPVLVGRPADALAVTSAAERLGARAPRLHVLGAVEGRRPVAGGGPGRVLVLGSARLLAACTTAAGRNAFGVGPAPGSPSRTHYAVCPDGLAPTELRGRLLELAQAEALVAAIGPLRRDGYDARAKWRAAALDRERRAARGVEPGQGQKTPGAPRPAGAARELRPGPQLDISA